jgi:hypothetical protein
MDTQRGLTIGNERNLALSDVMQLGGVFFKSGLFTDVKSEAQAVVKILAGRELGFPAMASMIGIDILFGKPTLSADLMGALVKKDGRYNFRVIKHTANDCTIEFYENGKLCHSETYTIEMAKQAGLISKNDLWTKYPRDMLYARALSRGAKIVCPQRMAGVDISEELSAPAETGEIAMTQEERKAAADTAVEELTGMSPAQADAELAAHRERATEPIPTGRDERLAFIKAHCGDINWTVNDVTKYAFENFKRTNPTLCTDDELLTLCRLVTTKPTTGQTEDAEQVGT